MTKKLLGLVGLCLSTASACSAPGDSAPDLTDAAASAVDAAPVPLTACEQLGLATRDFVVAPDSEELFAIAADLTLPTTAGNWNLAANYSGCDVYLFIQDEPRQAGADWPTPLWDRDVATLLARLPKNVHLFFMANAVLTADIEPALAALAARIDAALADLPESDRVWWQDRIHYVNQGAKTLDGWLGDVMQWPAWGAAIDRFGRIRYIGSYGDASRWNDSMGWFEPNLAMAANEVVYYNFEAAREDRLTAMNPTIVPVFSGAVVTGSGAAEIVLPDAATMAGFDTLELDLTLACDGTGEFGTCPPWDYLVYLYLCDQGAPDVCTTRIGRWITTYHREGRWVHDVSGLLPLFSEGGTRRLVFATQQTYVLDLRLRLSNQGKAARPVAATYLFSGGAFDATYSDRYDPITIAIPADAAKVELATVISGHGMADPGNCAEFCDTSHTFSVNGHANVTSFPDAGTASHCMDLVADGTVPNQYGTWWYGRSGWCPGKEVPLVMTDITDQVTPGADAVFAYEAAYAGAPYPAGGAYIELSSWVVVSK
jgi:hypothetical protein